jgi:hypothetical protein
MKQLPTYFCIKADLNNPLWKKYIDWLNKKYNILPDGWKGSIWTFYGYDGNEKSTTNGTDAFFELKGFQNSPTIITLEYWNECINGEQKLKVGDTVVLHGLEYKVIQNSNGWYDNSYYLNTGIGENDSAFIKLGIQDKHKFQEDVLGYRHRCNGDFPYCHNLSDLTKLVNALKNYNTEKKVIGYKAPFNINAIIGKGTIYINDSGNYCPKGKEGNGSQWYLPKEIVETWEKVYSDEKLMLDKYEIKFNGNTVEVGCTCTSKEWWESAKMITDNPKAKIMVGCSHQFELKPELIDKVLERLK